MITKMLKNNPELLLIPVLILFFGCSSSSSLARKQNPVMRKDTNVIADSTLYEPPKVVGGYSVLLSHLVYPQEALKNHVYGKVILKCTITLKGWAKDIRVVKGLGSGCDQAAIQALLETKFVPGTYKHIPIESQFTFPVMFGY